MFKIATPNIFHTNLSHSYKTHLCSETQSFFSFLFIYLLFCGARPLGRGKKYLSPLCRETEGREGTAVHLRNESEEWNDLFTA